MADNVLGVLFGDIADAIRGKTGDTATMKPAEFPAKIEAIETGGGDASLEEIDILIDEINGEVIGGKVVTFIGADGAELCKLSVVEGGDCTNPAATGLIATPTKEGTDDVSHVFNGWSRTQGGAADANALKNITEDCTVYAAFVAHNRITFFGPDGAELYEDFVAPGSNARDPVAYRYIPTPTKASTPKYEYAYAGWSLTEGGAVDANALKNVTTARNVYAVFTETVRSYTVRFYDEGTLLHTESVLYGASSAYTYNKTGAYFKGWTPAPTLITGDLDCYGEWVFASFAADDWETVVANAESGNASEFYNLGDVRELELNYADGTKETIIVQIVGFNDSNGYKDVLASNGTTKTGITLMTKTALATPMLYKTTPNEYGQYSPTGYEGSDVYTHLGETVLPALPAALRTSIKEVRKVCERAKGYSNGISGYETYNLGCKLWIPSVWDVGAGNSGLHPAQGGTAYGFFSDAEDRLVTLHGSSDAVTYWTRSISNAGHRYEVTIGMDGTASVGIAYSTEAHVAFGFCL